MFRAKLLIAYLEQYKRHLGLDVYSEGSYDAARGEMGLLDSFTWFYAQSNMHAAKYCKLTAGRILGFNTPEELDLIIDMYMTVRGNE